MVRKKKPVKKGKGGRPSPYDPDTYPEYARALAIEGLTNEEIAAKLGITRTTLQEWKKRYPDFSDAIKEGKEPANAKVEMALYKKALGFEVTETRAVVVGTGEYAKVEYVEETRVIPPDNTACIFWLKNRRPDKWRDKQEVEHSGTISWMELVKHAGNKPD